MVRLAGQRFNIEDFQSRIIQLTKATSWREQSTVLAPSAYHLDQRQRKSHMQPRALLSIEFYKVNSTLISMHDLELN